MKIAIGFDLHNTIVESNSAWLKAFILHNNNNTDKSYIEFLIYNKVSRKKIASEIEADYDEVLSDYHRFVKADAKMVALIRELYGKFPLYLISSSSKEKVMRDLESWNGKQYFLEIYTKETFCKNKEMDWNKLLDELNVDLLIYLGNDFEEDIIECNRVLSLISGEFLKSLSKLGFLLRRGENLD